MITIASILYFIFQVNGQREKIMGMLRVRVKPTTGGS
jgi:hypothetical protein